MKDHRLETMYDDLFGTRKNEPTDIDIDAVNKTLDMIFGTGGADRGTTDGTKPGAGGVDQNAAGTVHGESSTKPGATDDAVHGAADSNESGAGIADPGSADGRKEDTAQDGSQESQAQEAQAVQEEETDPMEELDGLIGLTAIKHDVKELIAYVKVQKMRADSGLKSAPVSLHLVFTGNPGTGKTTVARIISKLYKQIGVLSKGQLVEVDRSGLVAGYVGQTAIKTQKKIEEAMGGILFIDEAYALAKEGNDFGQEAIDTILKAMEDNRADFVVIVAGYTEPMEHFIESNPGLKSRFNKYIEFADYTMQELTDIFKMYCDKYEYIIDEENLARVTEMLRIKKTETIENFANAREARNLFEKIITNQARRISEIEEPSVEDMKTIAYEDLFDDDEK